MESSRCNGINTKKEQCNNQALFNGFCYNHIPSKKAPVRKKCKTCGKELKFYTERVEKKCIWCIYGNR